MLSFCPSSVFRLFFPLHKHINIKLLFGFIVSLTTTKKFYDAHHMIVSAEVQRRELTIDFGWFWFIRGHYGSLWLVMAHCGSLQLIVADLGLALPASILWNVHLSTEFTSAVLNITELAKMMLNQPKLIANCVIFKSSWSLYALAIPHLL